MLEKRLFLYCIIIAAGARAMVLPNAGNTVPFQCHDIEESGQFVWKVTPLDVHCDEQWLFQNDTVAGHWDKDSSSSDRVKEGWFSHDSCLPQIRFKRDCLDTGVVDDTIFLRSDSNANMQNNGGATGGRMSLFTLLLFIALLV